MPVWIADRTDLTLDVVERVAWRGEPIRLAPEALERIAASRRSFVDLLEQEPDVNIYGVTHGVGDRASVRLSTEERSRQAAAVADIGVSFGRALPERVTRAIVLARLANLIEGHAAVTPDLAEAVAGLLGGPPLPPVPVEGNGGSGEILALAHLFGPLLRRFPVADKEGLALVNGSPAAAAMLADAALAARRRLDLALDVFALAIEAFRAPLEAYDPVLAGLWNDPFETEALSALGERLAGADPARRPHQAPVSFRIVPRILGQVARTVAAAEDAATVSLASVSDNPVYLAPTVDFPLGRAISTGGYHNAVAAPALDALSRTWADLCQLAERHVEKLVGATIETSGADSGASELVGLLTMLTVARSEEARDAAQPTILPRGGPGQNDVGSPSFAAWDKERRAGEAAIGVLTVLAVAASQVLVLEGREPASALRPLLTAIRAEVPPIVERRAFGEEVGLLAGRFGRRVVPA